MICPRCRCEVGNQIKCPYCGTHLHEYRNAGILDATVPVNQNAYQDDSLKKHIANIDTWSLINVVLLGGVFVTNILQLILQLAG